MRSQSTRKRMKGKVQPRGVFVLPGATWLLLLQLSRSKSTFPPSPPASPSIDSHFVKQPRFPPSLWHLLLLPPPKPQDPAATGRDTVPKKLCSPPLSTLPRLCSFPPTAVTITARVRFTLSNVLVRQGPQSQSETPKHTGHLLAEQ